MQASATPSPALPAVEGLAMQRDTGHREQHRARLGHQA